MNGAAPWSVKGIDPRAREAAREAARRQGLTIGEWLNQAILANEAALADARRDDGAPREARPVDTSMGRDQRLAEALQQLAERVDVNDRRNALAMSGVDRTLSAVAARLEHAEAEARGDNGRVSDLLDELRDAQSVLLEQMRRIETEDMPALKAELGAPTERLGAMEGDLHALSQRAIEAEAATGEALAKLDGAMSALDAQVASAVRQDQFDVQTARLRETFESGLDTMAQDVASMIAETRADIAGQIVAALGGLQPEEMNEALADMSRRLATAERRHTQTIEAVSIEIKRLSESMDRRLRVVEARNDDGGAIREEIVSMSQAVEHRLAEMEAREAAAFSRMGEEVGRIAERLDVRVSTSEARSADAIEKVGEQVAVMAERLSAKQDRFAAEVSERMVQSEERQTGRLSQALSAISTRLGAIETRTAETISPVSQAMTIFAARLKALEEQAGAPVTLPDTEPTLAPAFLDEPVVHAYGRHTPAPAPRLEHEDDLHARHAPAGGEETGDAPAARPGALTAEAAAAQAQAPHQQAPPPFEDAVAGREAADDWATSGSSRSDWDRAEPPLTDEARTDEARTDEARTDEARPDEARGDYRSPEQWRADAERRDWETSPSEDRHAPADGEAMRADAFARAGAAPPREEIYLEDIEEEFARRDEDPAYAPQFELPTQARSLDDPFADIESAPPEDDEEDLFWSTGRPADAIPAAETHAAAPFPSAGEDEFAPPLPDGETAGDERAAAGARRFPLDDDLEPLGAAPLSDEQEIERAMFDAGDGAAAAAPKEDAPKEDYLTAARRAAQANAQTAKSRGRKAPVRPDAGRAAPPTPAAGLRGVSRVVLWGAAGALAAALAGGVYVYGAHRDGPKQNDLDARANRKSAALNAAPPGSIAEGAARAAAGDQPAPPAPDAVPLEGQDAPPAHAGPLDGAKLTPSSATASAAAEAMSATFLTVDAAAAHGDPVAQYDVALRKLSAGDAQDGVVSLRRAANQGLAMAQYRLAKLYERGEGVPMDLNQARLWTERAAVAGNRKAMHDLGVYYARGEGAPFDEGAAFKWFRQAAEYGVGDSQFNLGVLYAQGRGVTADPGEAYFWFSVAGAGGDSDARARAGMLEEKLDAREIAQLKARVRAFRPKPGVPRANGEFGKRAWTAAPAIEASVDSAPRS